MTRKLNIPNKLSKWPQQWHLHILNTFDLYFDSEKRVSFLDADSIPCATFSINPGAEKLYTSILPELKLEDENKESINDESCIKIDMKKYQENLNRFIEEQELYSLELRLYFKIETYHYLVTISYAGSGQIYVILLYLTRIDINSIDNEYRSKLETVNGQTSVLVVFPVGQGYEDSAYNLAKNVEKYIIDDYKRRTDFGNNDDNGNDSPVEPFNPFDNDDLTLSPVGDLNKSSS